MRQALIDLISRMTVPDQQANSDRSISWRGYRDAEALSDASMIHELAEYVRCESDQQRRTAAYFMLGKLGEKFPSSECVTVLLEQARTEKNKYALSTLLDALSRLFKPSNLDLSPVFGFLEDERWLVRHTAIQSLKGTNSTEAENLLIRVLENTNDPRDIVYCQATLSKIGSTKAIPYIEKNLKSRKRDVKISARLAIEAIQARERSKDRK